ncbi:acyl-ACP--UDP-N-acetylglucosamine O-acyltransferase [candidate division NPL-UPA2 bacterium]|nr:acyl-ACP--UDP-N-acetylglucosamine O-acyltransferase [candidate division NPL-UPA2 bacterium]
MGIHPTAIIHPGARLAPGVEIGPYTSIGENVSLGPGTIVGDHAFIDGWTSIGEGNRIFPGAVIGTEPQDLKYKGEKTSLEIGDNNVIREYVTIHRGTVGGGGKTTIGNNCFFMVYTHVAHDCHIGDNVVMSNLATLGGHVTIQDGVWLGGLVGLHHFVTVGRLAFLGGYSKIVKDVPPFMLADGQPAVVKGLNLVGLRRANLSKEKIASLKKAHQILYRSRLNTSQAIERIEREVELTEEVSFLIEFIKRAARGEMGRAAESKNRE